METQQAPGAVLTSTLVADLSRRLFGKRLVFAIPAATALLLAEAPQAAHSEPAIVAIPVPLPLPGQLKQFPQASLPRAAGRSRPGHGSGASIP